ncbi:MAG: alpha-hydroxy acid oxidase [Sphingomonas sp.]
MAERLAELRDAGCGAVVLTADLLPDGRAAPPPPPRAAWEASAGWEGETAYTGGTLDDLAWLCAAAGVPVLVKGVLRADDAALCIEHGARGVIVSNHGGNQLDTAIASADALAAVVDACGASGEVLVDGGIRRGTAVLKALALGARAVLVGRPVSHALAAGGAEGVESMLGRLGAELARAMALCGAARLADLDRSLVAIR